MQAGLCSHSEARPGGSQRRGPAASETWTSLISWGAPCPFLPQEAPPVPHTCVPGDVTLETVTMYVSTSPRISICLPPSPAPIPKPSAAKGWRTRIGLIYNEV